MPTFNGDNNDNPNLTGSNTSDTINGFGGLDTLTGFAGVDTLFGGADRDILFAYLPDANYQSYASFDPPTPSNWGESGNEYLYGEGGDDDLVGDEYTSFYGGEGNDRAYVSFTDSAFGVSVLQTSDPANYLFLSNGNFRGSASSIESFQIHGSGFADSIALGAGDDVVLAGAGGDTVTLGAGIDFAAGGAGADNLSGGSDGDILYAHIRVSSVSIFPAQGMSDWGDGSADVLNGDGGADSLIGDEFTTFNGGEGSDGGYVSFVDSAFGVSMLGNANPTSYVFVSNGTFRGNASSMEQWSVYGSAYGDTIQLSFGNDDVQAGAGADTVSGGIGNDEIVGSDGADTLNGGADQDKLFAGGWSFSYGFGSAVGNPQNHSWGDGSADILNGDGGSDDLIGDHFTTFNGGEGYDRAYIDFQESTVGVNMLRDINPEEFFFQASGNRLGAVTSVDEMTILGSAFNDYILLGASLNEVNAGAGSDIVEVGDTQRSNDLIGGAGIDRLSGGGVGDRLFANEYDEDYFFLDATAPFFDLADPSLWGDGTRDVLNGNNGSDALIGDEFVVYNGGEGSDRAYVSFVDSGVGVTMVRGAAPDIYSFVSGGITRGNVTSVETLTIYGSAFADTIRLGAGNDQVVAGGGADTIDAGAGADIMRGGADGDTYIVDNLGDVVDESIAGSNGIDTVNSSTISIDFTNTALFSGAVERITLEGSAALNATGNALDNFISGNSAANTIDGRGGADLLRGLGGDDIYIVDDAGDIVNEGSSGSNGIDTVKSSTISIDFTNTALFSGAVERITLEGSLALNATSNALDNFITGNSGANTIDGSGGADLLRGLGGNDTYIVDNVGDVVNEGSSGSNGIDTVKSSSLSIDLLNAAQFSGAIERITLEGTSGFNASGNGLDNLITGNSGANRVDGRGGADVSRGLGGSDTFVFRSAADSGLGANRDTINDFEDVGDNDTLDLSGFAGTLSYIGQAVFTAANQVRATQSGNHVLVEINTVGVNGAESEILLANTTIGQIDVGDFIV